MDPSFVFSDTPPHAFPFAIPTRKGATAAAAALDADIYSKSSAIDPYFIDDVDGSDEDSNSDVTITPATFTRSRSRRRPRSAPTNNRHQHAHAYAAPSPPLAAEAPTTTPPGPDARALAPNSLCKQPRTLFVRFLILGGVAAALLVYLQLAHTRLSLRLQRGLEKTQSHPTAATVTVDPQTFSAQTPENNLVEDIFGCVRDFAMIRKQAIDLGCHDEFISKINQFQHLLIDPKGLSYYLRRLSAARLSLILGAAFQVERIQNDPNLRGPVQYDKLAVPDASSIIISSIAALHARDAAIQTSKNAHHELDNVREALNKHGTGLSAQCLGHRCSSRMRTSWLHPDYWGRRRQLRKLEAFLEEVLLLVDFGFSNLCEHESLFQDCGAKGAQFLKQLGKWKEFMDAGQWEALVPSHIHAGPKDEAKVIV